MDHRASTVVTPVILSGGAGSGLWPLSRAGFPKQFLPLVSELTMIQEAALRVAAEGFAPPMVICSEEHRFIVAEQLRVQSIRPSEIILEPVARGTAAAACVAALRLLTKGAGGLMLVMPSDHLVASPERLQGAVSGACAAASAGRMVALGVVPDRPATTNGYIKFRPEMAAADGVHPVERFVEHPDPDMARACVDDGRYLWNSGIFLVSPSAYLSALEAACPDMVRACREALAGGERDATFHRLDTEAFAASPDVTLDRIVLASVDAAVMPMDVGWSDVGCWSALWDVGDKDGDGNVVQGDVLLEAVRNGYVRSEHRLVAVLGLDDVVVVETDDAVLVADRARAPDVKALVERLRAQARSEHGQNSTVHRPWGSYRGIDRGERFQVKRIVVQPGERLSLQMHHHRAEHWVVVTGTARVTRGEESFLLRENESTYIPAGETHRLENPGLLPLHLIEVQSGGYLGEDDIVRFEDGYGRSARAPSSHQ